MLHLTGPRCSVRVLVLIDQYNAFKSPGFLMNTEGKREPYQEPDDNAVASAFCDVNNFYVVCDFKGFPNSSNLLILAEWWPRCCPVCLVSHRSPP